MTQTIQCPFCSAAVEARDVNLARVLAKCRGCYAVFNFRDQLGGATGFAPGAPREFRLRPTEPLELPAGLRREEHRNELRFSMSWYGPAAWGLGFFCAIWDGFMIVWYTIAITQGQWAMALFGLLHLAVGVGLTYAVAAMFFNTSRVRLGPAQLDVSHGPFPTGEGASLPTSEIQQLFVTKVSNGFELHALLPDGSSKKVLGLNTVDQGHYLEQQIEAYLSIEDRPVKGEL